MIIKIFDPLDLTSSGIRKAKILMQTLRQSNIDWNGVLPSNLMAE